MALAASIWGGIDCHQRFSGSTECLKEHLQKATDSLCRFFMQRMSRHHRRLVRVENDKVR